MEILAASPQKADWPILWFISITFIFMVWEMILINDLALHSKLLSILDQKEELAVYSPTQVIGALIQRSTTICILSMVKQFCMLFTFCGEVPQSIFILMVYTETHIRLWIGPKEEEVTFELTEGIIIWQDVTIDCS